MDITMRMVVIAMISLAVAAIAMYMVQTERSNFMDFTDSSTKDADCQLKEAKYRRACNCTAEQDKNTETTKAKNIKTESQNLDCPWAEGGFNFCKKNYC